MQITNELLNERRGLIGVFTDNQQELFSLWPQPALREFLRIFLCLFRINEAVITHHPGSPSQSVTGVFRPLTIESFIPGMETKYNVS